MTAVERLLQQLGTVMLLAGKQHAARMKIMFGRGLGLLEPELAESVPQFGIGQTSADDRAMQVAVEFPYLAPAVRRWRQYLLDAQR